MMQVITVKTKILTNRDDVVQAICKYAGDRLGPDDIVTIAESVVAITQGRFKRPEDYNLCFFAKILCRFFPQKGSVAVWHSMQALIDEQGLARVLFAFVIGSVGKVVGKKGLFYDLVGEQGRLIDDITGTVPPFDKCVVCGPVNANEVCEQIRLATGCYGAAIVDANDLKEVAIVGTSDGLQTDKMVQLLLSNPFGNDNQKTPIVIIKNYKQNQAK